MPARFVEVVDVGAEASSTVAALLASGQGLVGTLSFNLSDYVNASCGGDALREALALYNVTLDWDAWRQFAWAGPLGVALNITAPDVAPPPTTARHMLLVGASIWAARELYVRWRVRRAIRERSGRLRRKKSF